MTSSLVGSEMCIRDRGKRPCSSPACLGSMATPSACRSVLAAPATAPSLSCLLYTSDAADDM
eukprot:6987552-Prorocentrum_lima.AAC.1